jgi:hypothetical protein
MPLTSTISPEYGCSCPPPPCSSPPARHARDHGGGGCAGCRDRPHPWLLRLIVVLVVLVVLLFGCCGCSGLPWLGRFRFCCWRDVAPCPFCCRPVVLAPVGELRRLDEDRRPRVDSGRWRRPGRRSRPRLGWRMSAGGASARSRPWPSRHEAPAGLAPPAPLVPWVLSPLPIAVRRRRRWWSRRWRQGSGR